MICYGKGAAFLKQLQKIIGETKFKEGLQKFTD
jgi:aminopeptidase N